MLPKHCDIEYMLVSALTTGKGFLCVVNSVKLYINVLLQWIIHFLSISLCKMTLPQSICHKLFHCLRLKLLLPFVVTALFVIT
jgi:hypothetical protein